MADEKSVMLREIALQPEFVRDNVEPMLERAREAFSTREVVTAGSGFAIGCGDSFCAALAARSYMMARTKRWFEPIEALEFSHYLVPALAPGSLVFGVSNSGSVTRTIEGVRRARHAGAWTFAVTVGTQNELAQTAETVIAVNAVPNIKVQPDGSKVVTPGTITYTASMLGLVVAGIALGQRLGSLSSIDVITAGTELRALADQMAEADAAVSAVVAQIAQTMSPQRTTVVIGAGPNYATAYYGMAKLYEAAQWPAHHAQIEEWAHEHYFITGPQTDTIVIAPPGAGRERGLEQVRAARDMGSRTIVLGARSDDRARATADVFIGLPDNIPEALTPFVYKLPFEYLAYELAQRFATSFFQFNDPLRQQVNFRGIFESSRLTAPPAAG